MKAWLAGVIPGRGQFRCTDCDSAVVLRPEETLPTCPNCGGTVWVRVSLFSTGDHKPSWEAPEASSREPFVVIRKNLEPGRYLAWLSEGKVVVYRLVQEWTSIGRSLAAPVRFDDPTVSRRHALVVGFADGFRIFDDRSLNGVFVNGERISDGATLNDDDEIVIGKHHLFFFEKAPDPLPTQPPPEHPTVILPPDEPL